jgi:hypothetical protein
MKVRLCVPVESTLSKDDLAFLLFSKGLNITEVIVEDTDSFEPTPLTIDNDSVNGEKNKFFKKFEKLKEQKHNLYTRLSNPNFSANAPREIVEKAKNDLDKVEKEHSIISMKCYAIVEKDIRSVEDGLSEVRAVIDSYLHN